MKLSKNVSKETIANKEIEIKIRRMIKSIINSKGFNQILIMIFIGVTRLSKGYVQLRMKIYYFKN